MSQENVELYYQVIDAVNRRDLDALLAMMDPDVEAGSRVIVIEGGYQGHEGMRRWWGNLFDVFPDFTIEVVEVRELGDVTVAALRTRGHGSGSNAPFADQIWQVAGWRGGKCIWWRVFNSQGEALEAVGLSE